MATSFAFISAGQLHVWEEGRRPQPIDSQFAREMEERQEKARRRHGWKGESDDLVAGIPGAAVWGKQGLANAAPLRVDCTAIARGPQPGELSFALHVGAVGGLFDRNLVDGDERRLVHRANMRVEEMDRHPEDGTLVFAERAENGTLHLALKRATDNSGREITDGDSFDQAPSWVAGCTDKVVYQSAGIARNRYGGVAAVAPFVLHELDVRTGEITTLLEDAERDLLLPHKLADGSVLFIQRPYEQPGRVNHARTLLDVLLLPWRLLETLFHFLNFKSLIYSGKPLAKAGEARTMEANLKQLILWGRAVEHDKKAVEAKQEAAPNLVPDSWQLIQRAADGSEETIGKNVLGYDVAPDGTILFTDGRAVFRARTGAKPEKLLEHFPIEKIVALS